MTAAPNSAEPGAPALMLTGAGAGAVRSLERLTRSGARCTVTTGFGFGLGFGLATAVKPISPNDGAAATPSTSASGTAAACWTPVGASVVVAAVSMLAGAA